MKFLKRNQNTQTYTYTHEQDLRRLSSEAIDDVLRKYALQLRVLALMKLQKAGRTWL